MQLMQMQQMQMQMIQMPQGMLQGTQMVPGAPSQNENRTTQNSIDDLDPLFGGAHHDIKDSLSDNDEGDDDPVLSSIKSEMVWWKSSLYHVSGAIFEEESR